MTRLSDKKSLVYLNLLAIMNGDSIKMVSYIAEVKELITVLNADDMVTACKNMDNSNSNFQHFLGKDFLKRALFRQVHTGIVNYNVGKSMPFRRPFDTETIVDIASTSSPIDRLSLSVNLSSFRFRKNKH